MGIRGDFVGSVDVVHPTALRGIDQRASGGELQPLVPKRRLPAVPPAAGGVSSGDLRPDGRVLEAERHRPAPLCRDPPVPPEEESGVHPGAHRPSVTRTSVVFGGLSMFLFAILDVQYRYYLRSDLFLDIPSCIR